MHSLCAHHLPSTSGNIPHCTRTSTHTPSPAALPHLDVPIHPCFPLPGGLLPQTSPSGTNYPMVGVLSMCPPHHFSQFPTSGHPCGPARTRSFAYLALHGLRTTLCTLLHTSAHLCAPLCISTHPCATFALHFPGLVTLIRPSILTSDPFGYLGQLSPSATGHNAHPQTSVESRPNSAAPIQPICFFSVGLHNPHSHPRTLSGWVTIAKAACLFTV